MWHLSFEVSQTRQSVPSLVLSFNYELYICLTIGVLDVVFILEVVDHYMVVYPDVWTGFCRNK